MDEVAICSRETSQGSSSSFPWTLSNTTGWELLHFFFVSLAFRLRHSGLQGQKVTDALAWIHRRRGLETDQEVQFNVVNYSDDLGGCESDKARATESFAQLKWLLEDVGLQESVKKAESPSTEMVYLGVMFNTVKEFC